MGGAFTNNAYNSERQRACLRIYVTLSHACGWCTGGKIVAERSAPPLSLPSCAHHINVITFSKLLHCVPFLPCPCPLKLIRTSPATSQFSTKAYLLSVTYLICLFHPFCPSNIHHPASPDSHPTCRPTFTSRISPLRQARRRSESSSASGKRSLNFHG